MIDLVITDVDGVLTDNRVTYSGNIRIARTWTFNQYDWEATMLLKNMGIESIMLSGSQNGAFLKRSVELGVDYYASDNKKEWALDTYGDKRMRTAAFIGNDTMDMELLRAVSIAGAPLDSYHAVRAMVTRLHFGYVCQLGGGQGAFREFVDHVLLMF